MNNLHKSLSSVSRYLVATIHCDPLYSLMLERNYLNRAVADEVGKIGQNVHNFVGRNLMVFAGDAFDNSFKTD